MAERLLLSNFQCRYVEILNTGFSVLRKVALTQVCFVRTEPAIEIAAHAKQ